MAARVAWAYLAALLAAVVTGLVVVVVDQALAPVVCPQPGGDTLDDRAASCQLALALWAALLGFVAALAPVLRGLKQDWWLWVAMASGSIVLVVLDAVAQWWWWGALLMLPAVAALSSAEWSSQPRVTAGQRGVLAACAVGAAGLLAWWYLTG